VMESGLLNKFAATQCMRCITFVTFEVLDKHGDIYGHAGIHPKCGNFGPDLHHRYFQDLEQL
jgi:hypothetical protein